MKNFFKKLSFVLAIAMVLTSIAPATASAAEVVPAKKVNVKVDGEKVDTINLTVGETETVKIGLPVKKAYAGQKSTFKTAAVAEGTAVEVVRVGNRTYELTAVEAGEATITFGAAKTKKLANAGEFKVSKEVKVVVETNATLAVEATGASELTVTLPTADVKATDIVVKRGTTTVNATAVVDGTTAVVTTDAKMIAGTYTVTVGELSASCDVEEQRVAEITIVNEGDYVATNAAGTTIYVYYDVLDQYGDSVRGSAPISWTTSLNRTVNGECDATEGKMAFGKALNDNAALVYGSSVHLTAVYSKGTNVVTKTAEVKVGLPSKVDAINFAGVVKANTNKFTTLPSVLNTDVYYLAFTAVDQYKNPVDMSNFNYANVSFTSKNPLLVKVDKDVRGFVTIDDVDYALVKLVPGEFYSKGGSALINGISGQTGTMTATTLDVAPDQILTTFTMSAPTDIVSEGRTVELAFTALDQNGEAITSYRVLNGNVAFSTANGALELIEQNDGTAKLYYVAPGSGADDDNDLLVTITAVVPAGSVDSQTFYVKEKARPAAILSVGGSKAILEGDYVGILEQKNSALWWMPYFTYVDQYGREMSYTYHASEIAAWFAVSANKVAVEYTGSARLYAGMNGDDTAAIVSVPTSPSQETVSEVVTFKLVDAEGDVPGSAKKITYKAVDISKLVSFSATGVGYAYAKATDDAYDQTIRVAGVMSDGTVVNVPFEYNSTMNYFEIQVSGRNWGRPTDYKLPANAAVVSGNAITFTTSSATVAAIEGANGWKDVNSVAQVYRDEVLDVKVIINDVNNLDENGDPTQKDAVVATMNVSNIGPRATTINAGWGVVDGKAIINATDFDIDFEDPSGKYVSNDILDQYGQAFGSHLVWAEDGSSYAVGTDMTITISKVIENESGFNNRQIAVNGNASYNPTITGAEIGDTFTVTYSCGAASLTIEFTVGADENASFGTCYGRDESIMY